MKKSFGKASLLGAGLMILTSVFPPPCYAQDPFTKLGRGVANTLTGWVEVPKNICSTSTEENVLSGITLGTIKGLGLGLLRTGAGIYDIVTFPFPLPEGYRPFLEPEYVF